MPFWSIARVYHSAYRPFGSGALRIGSRCGAGESQRTSGTDRVAGASRVLAVSPENACRETRAEMARRILLALACIGAAEAGSALAEGTTPLTAANFDDFVEGALAAGKTAMVRFIASEG